MPQLEFRTFSSIPNVSHRDAATIFDVFAMVRTVQCRISYMRDYRFSFGLQLEYFNNSSTTSLGSLDMFSFSIYFILAIHCIAQSMTSINPPISGMWIANCDLKKASIVDAVTVDDESLGSLHASEKGDTWLDIPMYPPLIVQRKSRSGTKACLPDCHCK